MRAEVGPGRAGGWHTMPLGQVKGECKVWSCELARISASAFCLTHTADLQDMLSIAGSTQVELIIR